MPLEPGQTLLHYRLIAEIGQGGMGVVWRAEDTSLRREVAIKVLPDLAAAGVSASSANERLERFAREARLLAGLNHPNIASIYGLHEVDGTHFLAMELVEGEDLSQRIARGPIPLDEALPIARSIAEALSTAHASGVIHRDLKPANVRITPDGTVKVLDFGLAKALSGGDPDGSSSPVASPSLSPTVTSLGTVAGVLLGTAAYMSPEQARGKPVDRRADVWAFGCVLYEMLAGKLAFPGETITDTLAAVVRSEPDDDALPPIPPNVRRVLNLCLKKDPAARLRDLGDAMLLLDEPAQDPDDAVVSDTPSSRGTRWLPWAVALLATIAAIVFATRERDASDTPAPEPTYLTIALEPEQPLTFQDSPIVAVSRDGRKVVFVAGDPGTSGSQLYLRSLESRVAVPLAGTLMALNPFFSPDGNSIAYFSNGRLRRVDPGQGTTVDLAAASNTRGGVWLPDGRIVFAPTYSGGLYAVPESGGSIEPLVMPDEEAGERTLRWPTVLPDGKTLLYTVGTVDSPNNYDRAQIAAVTLPDGKPRVVLENANMVRFAPPGWLVFNRERRLYAVRFDPEALEIAGSPVQVRDAIGGDVTSGAGYFDISATGDLVCVDATTADARSELVVVKPGEEEDPQVLPISPRGIQWPALSPDGSRILFTEGGGLGVQGGNVWSYRFDDGSVRRLTFRGLEFYPIWRDDGTRVLYIRMDNDGGWATMDPGGGDVREIPASDPGLQQVRLPSSWSSRAGRIAFVQVEDVNRVGLITEDGLEDEIRVEDAATPTISPDGKWLAYMSPADGGRSEIFVEPLEGGGDRWQVSGGIGVYPRWSRDGRWLYFIAREEPNRPMFGVEIDTRNGFQYSAPRVVIEDTTDYATVTAPLVNWDTDGERFIFVRAQRAESDLSRIEVALDWAGSL